MKKHNPEENIGKKYSRLTIKSYVGMRGKFPYYNCACDCGGVRTARLHNIRNGITQSCGCLLMEKVATHRLCHTKAYRSWISMRQRCNDKNNKHYNYYGGRGIKVCSEWNSFETFLQDMGERPDGHSIDRIDVNGDYCKENCKWSTAKQQARNRRNSIVIKIDEQSRDLSEWCDIYGISNNTVLERLKRGWDKIAAVVTPVNQKPYSTLEA
jgi:hypothetical protein